MPRIVRTLSNAAVSGTLASVTSTVALALLARAEGHGALQPMNATSHWLHGKRAAGVEQADISHTAIGYTTHHAATLFWAVIFDQWVTRRPPSGPVPMLRDAMAMSAIAAAVDYTITPKRFTPGWELVLSKRSMAVVYAAMGIGLAAGALITQRES